MAIRIEQIDIKSISKIFVMKDEIKDFTSIVENFDKTVEQIKSDLNNKANLHHTHNISDIEGVGEGLHPVATSGDYNSLNNKPTSLPANGGNSDTVGGASLDDTSKGDRILWSSNKIDIESNNLKTTLEGKINTVRDSVSAINNTVSTLNDTVSTLESDVSSIGTQVTNIKANVESNKTEIDGVNTALESKVNVSKFESELTKLNELLGGKASTTLVNAILLEVQNARRGKSSLLDKIIELDSRLDKLEAKEFNASKDLPVGSIVWFTGSQAPETYKICNGSEIDRTTYSKLYGVIGTTFGSGNGATTFKLPDLVTEGKFIRSMGNNISLADEQGTEIADIRESYEGNFNPDKITLVGGKSFKNEVSISLEPNNISLLPCIKVEDNTSSDMDLPVGIFNWFTTNTLPEDYLKCEGQAISRTTYADLFKVIGTTYGNGDNSSTFNLPNLVTNNRFIKSKTSSSNIGSIFNSNIKLTDVREAYEGDKTLNKLYPLGANTFKSSVGSIDSELIPTSIALVPAIKVKKKNTTDDRVPVSLINWFTANGNIPSYLLCDGSNVSRTEYSELFALIGTTYGQGDGKNTFTLPNLIGKNRFIRSCGGKVTLGSTSELNVLDVRNAYEGNATTSELVAVGGSSFSKDVTINDLHPQNIALSPYIKSLKTVIVIGTEEKTRQRRSLSDNNNLVLTKEVKLTKGKAELTIKPEEINLSNISSCFVNIASTDQGDSFICDVLANATIKDNNITIFIKALDEKLNSSKITLNVNVY